MFQCVLAVVALMPSALHAATQEDKPLTLAVSNVGDFAQGYSWYLSVNSAGQAELTIDALGKSVRRRFDIPNEKIQLLRKAVSEEDFFGLADKYGQVVPDGRYNQKSTRRQKGLLIGLWSRSGSRGLAVGLEKSWLLPWARATWATRFLTAGPTKPPSSLKFSAWLFDMPPRGRC